MMLLLNTLSCLMFISVVSAMSPEGVETNRLMDELSRAKSLHLGFLRPPRIRTFNNYESEISKTTKTIEYIYKQLQCSYALFCVRYMRLIEGLLVDPISLVKGNFKNVLFDEEAAAMLAATMNVTYLKDFQNVIWTFWLYADRLHRFLESIAILDVTDNQYHSAILKVHPAVYTVLEQFLIAGDCLPYGVKDKLVLINKEVLQVTNKTDKLESTLALLDNNKSVFDQQKISNRNFGILTIGEQQISMNTLSLNGLLGIKTIVYQTLGNDFWEKVKYGPNFVYNTAMGLGVTITKQTDALMLFLKQYIDLLKVIALHLSRYFLMATTNAVRLRNDLLQARKEKVIVELVNLEQLINFIMKRTDDTMRFIICRIETCTIDSDGVPLRNASVEEIEGIIKLIISQAITIDPLTKYSIKKDDICTDDFDEFHASIVEQFYSFVKNTIIGLSNINFSIVHSFIDYTSSEQYQKIKVMSK